MKHELVSYVQEGWIKAGTEAVKQGILTTQDLLIMTTVAAMYTGKLLNEETTNEELAHTDEFFANVRNRVAANEQKEVA